MIVTFVGGPKHGTHEVWEETPSRVTVETPEGLFTYELRQQSGSSVGNNPIAWSHTTYAPLGLSIIEVMELGRDVRPPLYMD